MNNTKRNTKYKRNKMNLCLTDKKNDITVLALGNMLFSMSLIRKFIKFWCLK